MRHVPCKSDRERERGKTYVSKQSSLLYCAVLYTLSRVSRDSATHHRAEAQVIGLRVGHHAATERTRRGEATLQSARGTEGAHAAGIPAAMHVRMCRMQTTGKVSMLRWNQTRRKAQGAQVSHLRMRMRHKCRLLLHSITYPLRPRSRRQSPWMDRVA